MNAIMLSIHPQYVAKIKNGTKRYEFRRRLAKFKINKIYIYETFPSMKVVAEVQVLGELSGSPSDVWEKTKEFAGISYYDYVNYFYGKKEAFAYELGAVNVFEQAQNIEAFGLTCAPQSFVYINCDEEFQLSDSEIIKTMI